MLEKGGGSGWATSVVILTRKALEAGLDHFYGKALRTQGLLNGSGRDKLVCLPHYLRNVPDGRTLAAKVAWCWTALSDASHHRGLHMSPSVTELTAWLDTTEAFITVIDD